jgi:membrane protein DedA with SNARE-associated domain
MTNRSPDLRDPWPSLAARAKGLFSSRVLLVGAGILAALVIGAVVLHELAGNDLFSLVHTTSGDWAYLAVFGLVFGDAVVPILPGETTLNAASTLAAQGSLDLALVMVAGALGAIAGDSTVYWIARLGGKRIEPRLERLRKNPKVVTALEFLGSSAPVLLVGGRFVPGLRLAVNATMGLSSYPYRRFLLWSSIGGILWSVYTCGLAYLVGTALEEFPLASIVISATLTMAIVAAVFIATRRRRDKQPKRRC